MNNNGKIKEVNPDGDYEEIDSVSNDEVNRKMKMRAALRRGSGQTYLIECGRLSNENNLCGNRARAIR